MAVKDKHRRWLAAAARVLVRCHFLRPASQSLFSGWNRKTRRSRPASPNTTTRAATGTSRRFPGARRCTPRRWIAPHTAEASPPPAPAVSSQPTVPASPAVFPNPECSGRKNRDRSERRLLHNAQQDVRHGHKEKIHAALTPEPSEPASPEYEPRRSLGVPRP